VEAPEKPSKEQFYRGRSVARVEWWLDDGALPRLAWARLRVFDDGAADVCFGEGQTLYGFTDRQHASYFLAEDDYRTFAGIDGDDEREYGIRISEITPPTWADRDDLDFQYLGTY
jgi:hypothetical protein